LQLLIKPLYYTLLWDDSQLEQLYVLFKRKDEQPKHRCCPLYSKSCCRLGQRGRTRVESLDGGAVNELLVGLREGDMTKGLETNRSKKTGCLSLVSLLIIIIQ